MAAPLPNARSTEGTTTPPKPFSFTHEVGEGFIWGSVLSSAYHFSNGGLQAVWTKVPPVSSRWAVIWGTSRAIEHAMITARGKEEPVLNFAAGAAGAFGIVNVPKGVRAATGAALIGGALAGALGGGFHMFKEYRRWKLSLQQEDDTAPAVCPTCLQGRDPDEFPGTPPVVAH